MESPLRQLDAWQWFQRCEKRGHSRARRESTNSFGSNASVNALLAECKTTGARAIRLELDRSMIATMFEKRGFIAVLVLIAFGGAGVHAESTDAIEHIIRQP